VRTKTISVPAGPSQASAVSPCLTGEFAMGGGVRLLDSTWSILGSYPAFSSNVWVWAGSVALPDGASGSFIVYAICLGGTAKTVAS
jgi:hypothetical protein